MKKIPSRWSKMRLVEFWAEGAKMAKMPPQPRACFYWCLRPVLCKKYTFSIDTNLRTWKLGHVLCWLLNDIQKILDNTATDFRRWFCDHVLGLLVSSATQTNIKNSFKGNSIDVRTSCYYTRTTIMYKTPVQIQAQFLDTDFSIRRDRSRNVCWHGEGLHTFIIDIGYYAASSGNFLPVLAA